MKYIFVIQGEGRGHLTQSLALATMLRAEGHQVVKVLVGRCKNRELPSFFVDKIDAEIIQFDSPTIDYGRGRRRGAVLSTILRNSSPSKMFKWNKSINILSEQIEKSGADVVVSFYEFLLGMANLAQPIDIPVICIGHQFMVDHPKFAYGSKSETGALMLRLNNVICSYGATRRLALSFYDMPGSRSKRLRVVPPLLRPEIFDLTPTSGDYFLGYMLNPGYLSEVMKWKRANPSAKVHLFWDKSGVEECEERMEGLWLHKINDQKFLHYMAGCKGYITTAGFESVCEALYLGKPIVMIPAHIEQEINATDAHSVGAGVIAKEFNLSLLNSAIEQYSANTAEFRAWVDSSKERFLDALTNF